MSQIQPVAGKEAVVSCSEQSSAPKATGRVQYYFAYGSNLSTTQMGERCPSSYAVGLAWLPGWDWIINERHYANIVRRATTPPGTAGESQGDAEDPGVYGVVYNLAGTDQSTLDACEGVPWAYEKVLLNATALDGAGNAEGQVEVLVYVDFRNVRPDKPKPEYVDRMSRGVKEARAQWAFPEWFAKSVMRKHVPGLEW